MWENQFKKHVGKSIQETQQHNQTMFTCSFIFLIQSANKVYALV